MARVTFRIYDKKYQVLFPTEYKEREEAIAIKKIARMENNRGRKGDLMLVQFIDGKQIDVPVLADLAEVR